MLPASLDRGKGGEQTLTEPEVNLMMSFDTFETLVIDEILHRDQYRAEILNAISARLRGRIEIDLNLVVDCLHDRATYDLEEFWGEAEHVENPPIEELDLLRRSA